jgi:fibronectin type 3 domain-containing protein
MQISRHWRMNAQRYQLTGVRYENGEVRLQNRPVMIETEQAEEAPRPEEETIEAPALTVRVAVA